jgi:hypothetical protein
MSRWSSDSKQRASKRYLSIHARLTTEVLVDKLPDKIKRKRAKSARVKQQGA